MKVNVLLADSRIAPSGGGELILSVLCFPQAGEAFMPQRLSPEPAVYFDGTEGPTSINAKVVEATQSACQNAQGINIRPSTQDITVMKFT